MDNFGLLNVLAAKELLTPEHLQKLLLAERQCQTQAYELAMAKLRDRAARRRLMAQVVTFLGIAVGMLIAFRNEPETLKRILDHFISIAGGAGAAYGVAARGSNRKPELPAPTHNDSSTNSTL
jgi:hypothetical protein